MSISKTQVDRAGRALLDAQAHDLPEPRDAARTVDLWREMHATAMAWVQQSIRKRLTSARLDTKLASRLKRKPQIVAKLRRSSTRLSQMQDIAGCRVLLDTQADVDEAVSRIVRRTARAFEVQDIDDYRTLGRRDTGYRAVHVKLRRAERHVEVQLRTPLQHAWAEMVERAGERMSVRLKAGEGPDEILSFFRLLSDAFHLRESGSAVPMTMRKTLRDQYAVVQSHLPEDVEPTSPASISDLSLATRANNWLIVYNWRVGEFQHWIDMGTNPEVAAKKYSEQERKFPYKEGYEVVLIGADSSDTIRSTHSHYFGRTPNDLDPTGILSSIFD